MQGKANSTAVFDLSPALPEQHVSLEVDKARQREYKRWLLAGLVLLAAMLFNGYQRTQPFSLGYRLEEVNRQRAQAEALGQQLTLEVATLSTPARIEHLAVNQLHLVAPGPADAFVISRVAPSPQQPSFVVASR